MSATVPAEILIRSIHTVLVVFDPEARVTLWNPAARTALGLAEDATGAEVEDRLGAEVLAAVRTAMGRRRAARLDEVTLEIGGEPRIFGVTVSPLEEGERLLGAVLTGRDITERVRLSSTLEDLTRQAERAAALRRLVHELRTPLNAILATAQYLGLITDPEAPARRYADRIAEETERLARLLDGVSELQGAGDLALRTADPGPPVRRAVELLTPVAEDACVRLEAQVPVALPAIPHDPDRLEQVVVNLLQNAVEAAGAGGEVRVRVWTEADGVVLEVADTGPGVPEEIAPRLFEPFVSGKPGRGRGLGLAVCREIVEAHGGQVSWESEPGRGTRFRVRLPAP
ncbi:two-component system sensor histidine kinase NtrB [Deferrisoma palaeochoriense]